MHEVGERRRTLQPGHAPVEGVVAVGGGHASVLGGDGEQVDVGVPGVGCAVILEQVAEGVEGGDGLGGADEDPRVLVDGVGLVGGREGSVDRLGAVAGRVVREGLRGREGDGVGGGGQPVGRGGHLAGGIVAEEVGRAVLADAGGAASGRVIAQGLGAEDGGGAVAVGDGEQPSGGVVRERAGDAVGTRHAGGASVGAAQVGQLEGLRRAKIDKYLQTVDYFEAEATALPEPEEDGTELEAKTAAILSSMLLQMASGCVYETLLIDDWETDDLKKVKKVKRKKPKLNCLHC